MGQEATAVQAPMLRTVNVEGLFGEQDVEVTLADGGITLLFGTNGAGKSTILRIIAKMLAPDMSSLLSEPIRASALTFADGSRIQFDRAQSIWTEQTPSGDMRSGRIEGNHALLQDQVFQRWIVRSTPYSVVDGLLVDSDGDPVPTAVAEQLIPKLSEIARSRQQVVTRQQGTTHYVIEHATSLANGRRSAAQASPSPDAVRELVRPCRLINSDRLRLSAVHRKSLRTMGEEHAVVATAVQSIASDLTRVIKDARESSRSKTSDIDATFFTRALSALAAPHPLEEAQRTAVIQELKQLHERLSLCALATSQLDLPSLKQTAPAVQTIFDLYLADLLEKAQATTEVLTRLEVFANALNDHLVGKVASINAEDGLRLARTSDSQAVPLDSLSSGEQHLIVLFYYLIFHTQPAGLCLIDEPEISLNVDWQHRFIGNVIKVSGVAPQQYIIATHSPTLIREHESLLRPIVVV